MDWFCWYPELYKADTMHLTAEQDGIYRRLIDHYMETRRQILAADTALSRAAGIDMETWLKNAAIIRPFFSLTEDGFLRHKRCEIELDRQDARSRNRSESGKKGAESRWKNRQGNQNADSDPNGYAIATPMAKNAIGQDKTGESKKESKGRGTRFALQDPPADWIQFCVTQRPDLQPGGVFDQFRDYWIAKTGNAATKLDWFATWRNWVRNQKSSQTKGKTHENESRWDIAARKILDDRKVRADLALPDGTVESTEKLR